MKKIGRWGPALLLVLALSLGLAPSGRAAGAELRLTSPEQPPKAGETFTVTVDISGNPGFAGFQLTAPYDESAMECTSVNPGALVDGMMAISNKSAPDGAILIAVSDSDVNGDGRLAVFTFVAKKDLSSADFQTVNIMISNEKNEDIDCAVVHEVTKAPAPPEEQRDLEKEMETVIAELEGKTPPQERPATQPPAETQTPPVEQKPQTPERPSFSDMTGHWAEEDVVRAAELGLIGGYQDGTFKPDNDLTRAQFVTILYRQAGSPEVTEATPFTDIANVNREFQKAIAWAYGKKLVDGTSATTFNPQGTLSRQATMKILFQHSGGQAGAEQMFYGVYDSTFQDSAKLAEWARTPMYWGVYNTLIEAGEGDLLNPTASMTRAQLARSMVRYMDKIGGGTGT